MKNFLVTVLALVSISSCQSGKKEVTGGSNNLRVVGYLLSHDNDWHLGMDTLGWKGITDLNLAFLNPEADGSFTPNSAYTQLTTKGHAENVRVFFSIGGGEPPAYIADLIKADKRDAFAQAIAQFAVANSFDGVDVDLENALINEDYAPFVSAVHRAMKAVNKLTTAALASWNANQIHDTTLAQFDMIHIMSYDKTGPWNPANAGQHSPYSMAVNDFNYFTQTRGQAPSKLTIGLPFYGYGFGPGAPTGLTFGNIARQFPNSVDDDSVKVAAGGTIYYNGKKTIREKVKFAINSKAAGVMIWQIAGDARQPNSLLNVINTTN